MDVRLIDHARLILQDAPLSDETKAMVWDIWHDAPDSRILSRKLQTMAGLPADVAEELLAAKRLTDADADAVKRVVAVLQVLAQIPERTLALAERHHSVAARLIRAATQTAHGGE